METNNTQEIHDYKRKVLYTLLVHSIANKPSFSDLKDVITGI